MIPSALLPLLMQGGLKGWLPIKKVRQYIETTVAKEVSLENIANRQLLVDISVIHVHDAGTGIQRVVRSVLENLRSIDSSGNYILRTVVAESRNSYRYADGKNAGMQVTAQYGDIFLGLDLTAHLLPRHTKQLLKWKSSGVKMYFVVYDLLPLTKPEYFKIARSRHFARWTRLIAMMADGLLCISNTVRFDLQHWLSEKSSADSIDLPMHVIPLGSDFHRHPIGATTVGTDVRQALEKLQGKPWALMVGTLEPRKGHARVLEAFENLWRHGGQQALVIAGRPGWNTDELQQRIRHHPNISRNLFWLDDTTDVELQLLYKKATGVVVASLAEGYGLPLVEALHYKKPVLARDIPVFREVAASRAEYFADDTPYALGETLKNWLAGTTTKYMHLATQPLTSWSDTVDHILVAIHAEKPKEIGNPKEID